METEKPIIHNDCIMNKSPFIVGTCSIGDIYLYNENFKLLDIITVTSTNFTINLFNYDFKCIVIKNKETDKTISNFSNIVFKCENCN